jgi:hypothetical protein
LSNQLRAQSVDDRLDVFIVDGLSSVWDHFGCLNDRGRSPRTSQSAPAAALP